MGKSKQVESGIKWKESDETKLKEAVKNFNNKLDRLEEMELNVHLPEEASYTELRDRIKTRKEFNRQLKNLRDFQESTAEEVYVTESGLEITKWEKNVLDQARRSVITRKSNELKDLEKGSFMGSESYNQAAASKNKAQNLVKNLNLGNLEQAREYAKTTGASDFNFRQAENYKNAYMSKVLPQFKDLEGYEDLKQTLESKTNPIEFYNFLKNDENLRDVNQYYPENKNIVYAGNNRQKLFNKGLKNLGIM